MNKANSIVHYCNDQKDVFFLVESLKMTEFFIHQNADRKKYIEHKSTAIQKIRG
jgi:hypothetical protein